MVFFRVGGKAYAVPLVTPCSLSAFKTALLAELSLPEVVVYLTLNGSYLFKDDPILCDSDVLYAQVRAVGGKGGFGSMLRSLGSRMERTTNKEACRNLEGRRLRDVNNEKKMAEWLAKHEQEESLKCKAEEDRCEKLKKIVKSCDPTHAASDDAVINLYYKAIESSTETVIDAVSQGIKNAQASAGKRKCSEVNTDVVAPSKKANKFLWGTEYLSSGDDTAGTDVSDSEGCQHSTITTSVVEDDGVLNPSRETVSTHRCPSPTTTTPPPPHTLITCDVSTTPLHESLPGRDNDTCISSSYSKASPLKDSTLIELNANTNTSG